MTTQHIYKQPLFIHSDPLTLLLKEKFRPHSLMASYIIVLVLNLPIVVMAFRNGLWLSQGSQTGLLNDYAWWFYQFVSVPGVMLFFLWTPEGIFRVLEGLKENKAILLMNQQTDFENAYTEFVQRFSRAYSHWIWLLLCFIVVTLFTIFALIPEHSNFMSWQTSSVSMFWYHEFYWFVVFFIGALSFLRVIIAIFWFNLLFKEFQIDVKVLHPDGAGGLSPLGEFSVKVGYLLAIFGVAQVVVVWSQSTYLLPSQSVEPISSPAFFGLIGAYLILAPIIFFAPIGSAHSAMNRAKHDTIVAIADQFEADFAKVQTLIDKDADELKKGIEKIEQLKKIHDMTTSFPVWPFNIANIVRFVSAVLLPVILGVIAQLIDLAI